MGIEGLSKLLSDKGVIKTAKISEVCFGRRILFDISSYIFSYKASAGIRWTSSIIQLFTFFKNKRITCLVPVFDGTPPKEKELERKKRNEDFERSANSLEELIIDFDEYKEKGIASEKLLTEMKKIIAKESRKKGGSKYLSNNKNRKLLGEEDSIINIE